MRARTTTRSDAGQISTTLVFAVGSLLFTVLVFAGGAFDQDSAACRTQPGVTREARNSIPADYLALYRKAGKDSGIPWNLLAAIGKIESDHGRYSGSGVHSGANDAGAAGPMQIGIGGAASNTWGGAPRHRAGAKAGGYGVDGDGDGWADVYDPADAIPAAARFLKAHGAPADVRAAVYAYNHSTAYVNEVLGQAARYAHHGSRAATAPAGLGCERTAGQRMDDALAAWPTAPMIEPEAFPFGTGPPGAPEIVGSSSHRQMRSQRQPLLFSQRIFSPLPATPRTP